MKKKKMKRRTLSELVKYYCYLKIMRLNLLKV